MSSPKIWFDIAVIFNKRKVVKKQCMIWPNAYANDPDPGSGSKDLSLNWDHF